jgi:DNA-binding transcriptional MocR family regulator
MYLYERIFEDLRRAMDEGEIGPGERLPSIREVAELYGCNKITAQRAFELLSKLGRIENRVGSGSYVRFPEPLGEGRGDFSSALLSESFFPYDEAGSVLAGLLARERGRVFSAPAPRGEERLIAALAKQYELPAESILVTGGGQQGLDLVRRLFSERGEAMALVEEPTYPGALSLFRPKTAIPFGLEGPDPVELAAFFGSSGSGARFFYTIPQLHNPTGLRHSLERKKEIARLAAFLDFTIVEDDYLSELLPVREPRYVDLVPERTIWIKSLSKMTAPGIRVGVMAAPPQLLPRLLRLRAESDPGPATWLQLFASGVFESGLFDRQLGRVRAVTERRRLELLQLVSAFPALSPVHGSGFNLWVAALEQPKGTVQAWAEGWRFGRGAGTRKCFRLSTMGMSEEAWPEALDRLRLSLEAAFPDR